MAIVAPTGQKATEGHERATRQGRGEGRFVLPAEIHLQGISRGFWGRLEEWRQRFGQFACPFPRSGTFPTAQRRCSSPGIDLAASRLAEPQSPNAPGYLTFAGFPHDPFSTNHRVKSQFSTFIFVVCRDLTPWLPPLPPRQNLPTGRGSACIAQKVSFDEWAALWLATMSEDSLSGGNAFVDRVTIRSAVSRTWKIDDVQGCLGLRMWPRSLAAEKGWARGSAGERIAIGPRRSTSYSNPAEFRCRSILWPEFSAFLHPCAHPLHPD